MFLPYIDFSVCFGIFQATHVPREILPFISLSRSSSA